MSDEQHEIDLYAAKYVADFYPESLTQHNSLPDSWKKLSEIATIEANREHVRMERGINILLERTADDITDLAATVEEDPKKALGHYLTTLDPNLKIIEGITEGTLHRFIAWGADLIQSMNIEGKNPLEWSGVPKSAISAVKYGALVAEASRHVDYLHITKYPEHYGHDVSLNASKRAQSSGEVLLEKISLFDDEQLPLPSFNVLRETLTRYFGPKSPEALESLQTLFPGNTPAITYAPKPGTPRRPPDPSQKPSGASDELK